MNTNVIQFLESLEKLKPLTVSYLCADHYGYITGRSRKVHRPDAGSGPQVEADLENYYQNIMEILMRPGRPSRSPFIAKCRTTSSPLTSSKGLQQMLKFIGKNR